MRLIFRRSLSGLNTYVRRLRNWGWIAREVSGVDLGSKLALGLSIFAAPLTSAVDLGRWQDPLLLFRADVRVRGVGRFHLRARTDDLWHVLPQREPEIFEAISRSLQPGDVFVDAGANIGFYSVLAAQRVGKMGRVIAIEMMPDTAAILRKHSRWNGVTVDVFERALSDRTGEQIAATFAEGKSGQASIGRVVGERAVAVRSTTLDEMLRNTLRVRLVKMDLEGVEEQALRGATAVLDRIDAVIFECDPGDKSLVSLFERQGFDVRELNRRNFIASRMAGA